MSVITPTQNIQQTHFLSCCCANYPKIWGLEL